VAYKAYASDPGGMTNNKKVSCSGCHGNAYVKPLALQAAGGAWECPHCKKVN